MKSALEKEQFQVRMMTTTVPSILRKFSRSAALLTALSALLCFTHNAQATEAAFGRYIPGLFAGPLVDIVPPVPGFYWQSSSFFYSASASKNLNVPIGRSLETNVKGSFAGTSLSGVWVPDVNLGENINLGFGITIPFQHLKTTVGGRHFRRSDNSDGLGDILIMPFMLGWQKNGHFLSFNIGVYAPTGAYENGALANISTNYWTVTPSVAYSYVNAEHGYEFSTVFGVDFNTKNTRTDYRSGAMAHLDATLLKTFSNGLGVGVVGSVLYQIADDRGELADKLNGFKGRSFAVGPMLRYSHGKGLDAVNVSLNWAPEFAVEKRLKGNAVYLNINGKF